MLQKYLKYKNKYLTLKKGQIGGKLKSIGFDFLEKNFNIKKIKVKKSGKKGEKSFRIYFTYDNKFEISPWHDIPYKVNKIYNCVIEIPKRTTSKFEIATKEIHNPIKQDIKNNKLRELNIPQKWNYGAIPQTWEDNKKPDTHTNIIGDNDPIDCVEIGSKKLKVGQVLQVKILGILAMIDDDETDWKVICININDILASKINNVTDLLKYKKNELFEIRNWFWKYKAKNEIEGPFNKFHYHGKFHGSEFAIKVIEETHQSWKKHFFKTKQRLIK